MVDNRKSTIQRTRQLTGEKDTMNLFVLFAKLDKSHKPLKMMHLYQSKFLPKLPPIMSNVNIAIVILTNFPQKDTFHCKIRRMMFFFIRSFIFLVVKPNTNESRRIQLLQRRITSTHHREITADPNASIILNIRSTRHLPN